MQDEGKMLPHPLLPVAGDRADPGVKEWKSEPRISPAAAHQKAGSASLLGSTLELTLFRDQEMQVSHP